MTIKLDQNLSQYLRKDLTALGHDVDAVVEEGLSGATDADVLKKATAADRILFTLDRDFLDLKKYPPQSHRSVYRLPSATSRRVSSCEVRTRFCPQL